MNNWLTATFQTVREKSLDAIEFVRKDLTDFTTTVKSDAENYLNKIKSQSTGDLEGNRAGTSANDDGKNIIATGSFDRLQNERIRLQNDESTYLIDPTPIEMYENWRETHKFNVDDRKGEIAQLLIDSQHIRLMHARLVPACTSYSDFWSRYYFRLHQIDEEETRRTNLLKRAHEICNENHTNEWDEPDDEWTQETSNINQQAASDTTTIPENITCERKESDTVSGDSWEREFDVTDLSTSKSNTIPLNQLDETIHLENKSLPLTTINKADNEFDDEWESWS